MWAVCTYCDWAITIEDVSGGWGWPSSFPLSGNHCGALALVKTVCWVWQGGSHFAEVVPAGTCGLGRVGLQRNIRVG